MVAGQDSADRLLLKRSQGADIVVTGRSTDPGLVLSPLIAEFGWGKKDWNLLAAGTVAGLRIEGHPVPAQLGPEGRWMLAEYPWRPRQRVKISSST